MVPRLSQILSIVLVLYAAHIASASPISLGILSFDVLVPASGPQVGVNVINIENLSGTAGLAPDFPIATGLLLSNLTLTINTLGGQSILSMGDLAPGGSPNLPSLQFASNVLISSIVMAANIGPNSLFLADGSSKTLTSNSLLYVLSPTLGDSLQAGVDLGVFSIDAATSVPEPSTWAMSLVAGGVLLLRAWKRSS